VFVPSNISHTQEMGGEGDGTRYLQQKTSKVKKSKASTKSNQTRNTFYNLHNLLASADAYTL
jgi:hypothetical protein